MAARADRSGLLDRHLAFVEALRGAGLSVSLAEDLDAVAALSSVRWSDRATVRDAYAATMVKKQAQRTTFDALFEVYFPALVGDGARPGADSTGQRADSTGQEADSTRQEADSTVRDNAAALADLRERLAEALQMPEIDEQLMTQLAAEMVGVFGAMPGRGPGLSSWSAYTALRRVAPQELMDRIVQALLANGMDEDEAQRVANRRIGTITSRTEADARRRIAEEKGPDHIADVAIRPSIDQLAFMSARRADLDEMRTQIFPLARRLATRLAKEHHAKRRGPLDFRRTVRASIATGGVPLTTHHRPKRPHRTDLVVLCDVSGSVANFSQFTLMFAFALREVFQSMRAFTFIDHVHEVTSHFVPGADPVEVMADLAASTSHAALWGRTNYGRAFQKFQELHLDALGPKTTLLILGDARSNYSDLHEGTLRDLADASKRTFWLNPEHQRNWGTGDSAAHTYAEVVRMIECRNLTQLEEFVHDLAW